MAFFGKKTDATIKVEITNTDLPWKQSYNRPPEPNQTPSKRVLDYDFLFKAAAIIALSLNSFLAIMGYVNFIGKLDTLGISTSELDLGLPTLLFQGYISIILSMHTSTYGTWALIAILAVILSPLVFGTFKNHRVVDNISITLLASVFVIALSVAPLFGLTLGEKSAFKSFEKQNKVFPKHGLTANQSIKTKEGITLSGEVIFLSAQYTYILQNEEVFKVMNRDNHIVSITKLSINPPPTPLSGK